MNILAASIVALFVGLGTSLAYQHNKSGETLIDVRDSAVCTDALDRIAPDLNALVDATIAECETDNSCPAHVDDLDYFEFCDMSANRTHAACVQAIASGCFE
jgi:hypothetical protein